MATTHYHILAYADQSGEILKMKRLPSGVSDYLDKEIDGLYGEKLKLNLHTQTNIIKWLWLNKNNIFTTNR